MEDKLNPVTGLPDKPVLSKLDNIRVKSKAFENNLNGQPFDLQPFTTSKLDYNTYLDALGPDKFKLQFGDEVLTKQLQDKQQKDLIDAINKKADEQGILSEAFNSLTQAVVGEVIGGGIEGIGYLFELPRLFESQSDEKEWGNWLSQIGTSIREWTKEEAPIYRHYGEEGNFDPSSHEWWLSGLPSVASALSILIPVAGEAKAVSYIGKAIKGAAAVKNAGKLLTTADAVINAFGSLGKTERWFIDGLHKATVSRHIESMMEAGQVHTQMMEKYLGLGYSEEDARKYAAEAAAFNYKLNWGAMLTELPQYLMMGSSKFMNKEITNMALAKAAGISPWVPIGNVAKNVSGQALLEGLEEGYQYVISEEAMYNADKRSGLVPSSEFGSRFNKYIKDGEFWTSAFMGALGGAAMHGATSSSKLNTVWNKNLAGNKEYISEAQTRINEINSRNERLMENISHYQQAVESGNAAAVKVAQKNIAFDMATTAAQVGNLNLAISQIQQMQAMSEEDRQKLGLPDDFGDNLKLIEKDMQFAAQLYDKNSNKYHQATVMPITYREYVLDHWKKEKPILENSLKEMEDDIPGYKDLTEYGKFVAEWHSQIASLEQFVTNIEDRLANDKELTKEQKKELFESSNIAKAQIEVLNRQFEYNKSVNNNVTFVHDNDIKNGVITNELGNDNYNIEYTDIFGRKTTVTKNKSEIGPELNNRLSDNDLQVIDFIRGKYGEDLVKTKHSILQLDNQIKNITKKLAKLTSKEYQKNIQDIVERRAKMLADKKKREQQEAEREEDKKKLEPKKQEVKPEEAKPNKKEVVPEEEDEEDEDDDDLNYPEDDEDYTDNLIEQLDNGTAQESDFSDEVNQRIKERRAELAELQEAIDDHNQVGTQVIINEEPETPENPTKNIEYVRGTDKYDEALLKLINGLAWKSVNNRDQSEGLTPPNREMALALTSYLEDYVNSLDDHSVVFEIDLTLLENNQQIPAYKEILRRLYAKEPLSTKENPHFIIKNHQGVDQAWDLLGFVPIKAKLYKDGKQVVHRDQKLHLHLHTSMYRNQVHESVREAFDQINREQRADIEAAYHKNQQLEAKKLVKSGGHLYMQEKDSINPLQTLSEVIGSPESMELVAGSSELSGVFVDYSGKVVETGKNKGSVPGAIYSIIRTANGSKFPLRLNVSRLTIDEANIIHQLMFAMAKDEKLYDTYLSDDIINDLNNSSNPILNQLQNYLSLHEMKYGELLDHFVYNGKAKTETKGESALFIQNVSRDSIGNLLSRSIVFGSNKATVKNFGLPEVKAKFIQHLTDNRRRQVDRKLLNNNKYKSYLNSNRILTSNALHHHIAGRLFVQPTVSFNGNLSIVNDNTENDINFLKNKLESFSDVYLIYDTKNPIKEDSLDIINLIEERKNISIEYKKSKLKYTNPTLSEDEKEELASRMDQLQNKLKEIDSKILKSREELLHNHPIIKQINITRSRAIPILSKIKLNAKSNEWTSSMPISKSEFYTLSDNVKKLSIIEANEVTSNKEVIPIILETESILNKINNSTQPKPQVTNEPVVTSEDLKTKNTSTSESKLTSAEKMKASMIAQKKMSNKALSVAEQAFYNKHMVYIESLAGDIINNSKEENESGVEDKSSVTETKPPIVENKPKAKSIFEQNKAAIVNKDSKMTEEIFNSLSKREQDRIIECL